MTCYWRAVSVWCAAAADDDDDEQFGTWHFRRMTTRPLTKTPASRGGNKKLALLLLLVQPSETNHITQSLDNNNMQCERLANQPQDENRHNNNNSTSSRTCRGKEEPAERNGDSQSTVQLGQPNRASLFFLFQPANASLHKNHNNKKPNPRRYVAWQTSIAYPSTTPSPIFQCQTTPFLLF